MVVVASVILGERGVEVGDEGYGELFLARRDAAGGGVKTNDGTELKRNKKR